MSAPVLTAAEMRAAEVRVIAAGTSASVLMERAGVAAAEAIWRFAGPEPALVLCGPGNNGGDGYVVARLLAARGVPVRVAALVNPTSDAARIARANWSGPVEMLDPAAPAPLLIDALFGTGLTRPLDAGVAGTLGRLAESARYRVALDLPSGVASDDGAVLSPVPRFDLTVAFGALKPSHLLQPAARFMGRLTIAGIGVPVASALALVERPHLRRPGPQDHKYTRGLVTVLAGAMAGAATLSAKAAARAGAGAVRLQGRAVVPGVPAAIIQNGKGPLDRLDDQRVGAVVIGPGLSDDDEGRELTEAALGSGRALILDAGALAILAEAGPERLRDLRETAILTPHDGEFARLFGHPDGSKVDRARAAAARSGAVVVYKGPDTVIAHSDGRAALFPTRSNWLATGGTGDVLAGIIGTMRASGLDAFAAAQAGVWLHSEAGAEAGPALIADDVAAALPRVLARCF